MTGPIGELLSLSDYIVVIRVVTVKVLLIRSQKELSNKALET